MQFYYALSSWLSCQIWTCSGWILTAHHGGVLLFLHDDWCYTEMKAGSCPQLVFCAEIVNVLKFYNFYTRNSTNITYSVFIQIVFCCCCGMRAKTSEALSWFWQEKLWDSSTAGIINASATNDNWIKCQCVLLYQCIYLPNMLYDLWSVMCFWYPGCRISEQANSTQ